MDLSFFKNKNVVVMGLGRFGGGLDSARFTASAGAHVLVTDLANEADLQDSVEALKGFDVEFRLGEHREEDFRRADILIVNPAVPPDNKFVNLARQAAVLVTSQMELFFKLCPARIVGITGSNGKSTTTSLTYHLLSAAIGQKGVPYRNAWLGGNIGHQPLLEIVRKINKKDVVVLEISNLQLEQLARILTAPHISLITNLTPNHLDRHGTFEEYCRAKENIFKNQLLNVAAPAVSIFNADDPVSRTWYDKYSQQPGRRCLLFSADNVPAALADNFKLPGKANLANLAGAWTIASCFGIKTEQVADSLPEFTGLESRCRLVAEINGVRWYDDSKATTPISTMAALNGIDEPKTIIAGGYDKKISFDELGRCIANRAKAAVLIGQTAKTIAASITAAGHGSCQIRYADSMENAVKTASELAAAGEVVLMSPACASYDMFKNYVQRAEIFALAVNALHEPVRT
ncbi:MAG: UDP-N-acetylmuramoyl-L-alanine--D-glutamate ligase [Planctomycetaceae bacterium]|nr:UDP-N-acetylmuramoyl-L-alanine--D-glutamate ligase [Planctomycetaceae bacterium]